MAQWTVISRCVLFLLNVVLMLAALGVIGVGFWMRYDASFDADLKNVLYRNDDPKRLEDAKRALRVWITVVFWSSIGLSIGAAIITLFGMISSVSVKHRGFIITYLVLITLLALLQIGGVVAILIQRNALHNDTDELIDTMYITNSVADLRIIQDTYSCCGTTNGVYNAFYCNSVSTKPYCDDAMFESLDSTLMISVIVVLAIVSLEFIAIVLSVALFISIRNYYKYRYEPNEVTRF